jgi:hypothetical protein
MECVNIIIFTVLGLYLDQVIPNEFGKKRHWLLCLHRENKGRRLPNGGGFLQDEDESEN